MNASAIGLSALSVGQRAIDLIGQNVANASSPGYHRQELQLAARVDDGINGDGVQIQRVVRYEAGMLRDAILNSTSDSALATTRLDPEQQVERSLTSAGLDQQLGTFFDTVTQLTSRPSDMTLRRTVLSNATALSNTLNQLAVGVSQLRTQVKQNAIDTITTINQDAAGIAALNGQIAQIEATGLQANDLRDRRDQMINDLAGLVDVRVTTQDKGVITILAAGTPIVVGGDTFALSSMTDTSGNLVVHGADAAVALNVKGGKLGGLLQEHNQQLPAYMTRLNDFAAGLIRNVDNVQATGLGLNGPFIALVGQRAVASTTLPLNQAGLALPPQAGTLFVSVTDQASGNRTLHSVAIDPATQSLQDVTAAISAATAGRVQGTVTAGGTLDLQAAAGFAFDFAGQLPTDPENIAMNGTSVPKVTGTYSGTANDTYSFQIVGNGTVGVTTGLSLEVRDGTGALVTTLNVGQGYTSGTALNVAKGISVALSAGTTNGGSFSDRLVATPDSANILPALGLNTFFAGVDAATIAVQPALAADPGQLAASRGAPGDGRNLERLAALRDQPLLTGGTRTLGEHLLDTAAIVGDQVSSLGQNRDSAKALLSGLQQQEQSVIGVDVNEEMVKLLEFQRMIESGSKFLSVVNQALDSILTIVQ